MSTNKIDALAKNISQAYSQLSMGQGQEESARKLLLEGMERGQWIMMIMMIIMMIMMIMMMMT